MPKPELSNIMPFETAQKLAEWLKENHATETELWVKIFKNGSNVQSVTWDDVVVEALCWGWIDSIKKSIDEQAYIQRITPRKARSIWSKRNTEHVECLISEGRMREPGLVHVYAAKADGRWESAYRVSEMVVPTDFLAELETHPIAKAFYGSLNKSSRYIIAHGLTSAKKLETRQRRFSKYITMLVNKQKP